VQFLRRNWVGVMFCAIGLMLVVVFPFVRSQDRAYRSAAPCTASAPASACRATLAAEVPKMERHGSAGHPNREISFLIYGGPVSTAVPLR
jgi:hypothetical protein